MPDLPDGWQQTSCPLCSGQEHQSVCDSRDWILGSDTRFRVVRCRSCNLAFVNPRPGPQLIGQYYPPAYAPHQRRHDSFRTAGLKWLMLRHLYGADSLKPAGLARLLATLCIAIRGESSLPFGVAWHGQGRLLDFGCGGGEFLRRMSHLGWQVTGVDVSADAVKRVRDLGLEAFQGTFPHPGLAGRQFDVITMRMSLEHVHDPLETVRFAASLLAPAGRLAVIVPNFDSWCRRRFGEHCFSLDLPRHLIHFEPQTLKRLLEAAGLKVTQVRTSPDDGVVRKTIDLAQKDHQAAGLPGLLRNIKPLRKLLSRSRSRNLQGDDLFALGSQS